MSTTATRMPGRGKLTITGQLGDVMKESAQIALSLVRTHLSPLIIAENTSHAEFDKTDVHIHVPSGAIPKDGPSAGIAMFTTLASLFINRSISPKLAMTGEITLRGVKEKLIAAHRAGIERILLSRRNEKDLKDVPKEVKEQLKIEFVDTVSDVLRATLGLEMFKEAVVAPIVTSRLASGPHA